MIAHSQISDNSADAGGGIYCVGSSPNISHSEINGNQYVGIYCVDGSNPTIDNCTVVENQSHGIYCHESSPTISNCTISDNWELVAAGIWCESESNPIITNCTISRNCGGSGWANGGIVCHDNSSPLISYCTISDNGGTPGAGGINCALGSSPTIEYCLIIGNGGIVGGICCSQSSSPHIDHCTISGNSGFNSQGAGGMYISNTASLVITNTIVEGNIGEAAIWITNSPGLSITYCDFHNNGSSNFIGDIPAGLGELVMENLNGDSCDVFSNIFLDPLFVDTTSGNYHLQNGSPCVDAGNPSSPLDPDSTITDIGAFYLHQEGVQPGNSDNSIPTSFALHQNYPNPFNPITRLAYDLPTASRVMLSVYDILGLRIATLANGWQDAGTHQVTFDGSDLASGIYFYELSAGNYHAVRKAILLK
jgi:parallel beta-helix repeat protein